MSLGWKIFSVMVIGFLVMVLGWAFFGWPSPYITDLVP